MLALAQPAHAKIVYTPVHQKLPIDQDFFVDLSHDGTNDFKFHVNQKNVRHDSDTQSTYASLNVYPGQAGNHVVGGKSFSSTLSAGVRIGPKSPINDGGRVGMDGFETQSGAGGYWDPWANGGNGVQHRYLGVEFLIKGKLHFGWARFNVKIFSGQDGYPEVDAVLTGYAYETVANKPIIAGKTKGPEQAQGSLGALAAAGLASWRQAGLPISAP